MCAGPGLEGGIETRTRTVRDSGQFAGRNFHETVELIQQAIDLVPPGNPYIDAIANALAMPGTFGAELDAHLTVRQAEYAKRMGISERTYSRYINKGCELLAKQIDVVLKMRAEGMTVDQGNPTLEGLATRTSYLEQQLVRALSRIDALEAGTVQDNSHQETKMPSVVVDIGGSGVRLAVLEYGNLSTPTRQSVKSIDDLVHAIRDCTQSPSAVAISLAGFVDSKSGYVRLSRSAPWSEGKFKSRLSEILGCPVAVMNDGEAHAQAINQMSGVELGAVSLSLGTSVGMGLLDPDGRVIRPCSGENWDIGDVQLKNTSAADPSVWWALGSQGLADLEKKYGTSAGRQRFGFRLGSYIVQLCSTFQPKTVVLSGGIAVSAWEEMKGPIRSELERVPAHFVTPRVQLSPFAEAALVGAAYVIKPST